MDESDLELLSDGDENSDDEFLNNPAAIVLKLQLDSKSQWIETVLSNDVDLRRTAEAWGVRKQIWQRFWDRLFETTEYSTVKSKKGNWVFENEDLDPDSLEWEVHDGADQRLSHMPTRLSSFKGSMWERMQENIRIASQIGEEAYEDALGATDPEVSQHAKIHQAVQTICMKQLAGVDVYWDGLVEDEPREKDPQGNWYRRRKKNTSKSKFGTLRVLAFPFVAIFRYDDCPDYVIFTTLPVLNGIRRIPADALEELDAFVKVNLSAEVEKQRTIRLKIRCMDGQEITVQVGQKRKEVEAQLFLKHRDKEDAGDLWKNKTTKEIVSLVPGFQFEVKTTTHKKSEQKCMSFMCGEPEMGVHPDHFLKQKGNQTEEDEFDDGPKPLSPEALGIEHDYFTVNDPGIHKLVNEENIDPVYLDYVKKLYQTYRDYMQEDFEFKKKVLSYHFWFEVYNNDKLQLEDLQSTLSKREHHDNPLLKDLFFQGAHAAKLRDLYRRLKEYDDSLVLCCWYMFWHAVNLHNRARKHELYSPEVQRILDPSEPGSLNGQKLNRQDLTRILMANEVWYPDGSGVITDELLDTFYAKLDYLQAQSALKMKQQWKQKMFKESDVTEAARQASVLDIKAPDGRQSLKVDKKKKRKKKAKKLPSGGVEDLRVADQQRMCSRMCSGGQGGCDVM